MTHINVSEVLSSLSLAKEAYEALPDLRRQIDDLQAALASKDRLLSTTQETLNQANHTVDTLNVKVKEVESERDAYGFRAIDAEEKLEKVFGVVRPAAAAPQPPVVDQSASAPTVQTAQATTGAVSADTAASSSTEPGQSAPLPTQAPASTTTGTTEPIGVTEPVLNPTQEWGKQSDSGDESNIAELKPYTNKPSWEKPHDMAWAEWESKGGTVPGWMKQHG